MKTLDYQLQQMKISNLKITQLIMQCLCGINLKCPQPQDQLQKLMKILYLILLKIALSQMQESLTFCDNPIEYDINYYGKFISHLKLSNTTDVILADYRLIVIDDELNVLSSNSIPKKSNSTCEWIFQQNSEIIFVGCQKSGESPYLVAYKSINKTHFSQFGDIKYFPNLNETVLKIKGTLNTLFTVSSDEVRLFTLLLTLTDWGIEATDNILDHNYFGVPGKVNLVDITFAPYQADNLPFYKLIVVQKQHNCYWIDATVKNNILQPFRTGNIGLWSRYYEYISAYIHSTSMDQALITFIHTDNFYSFPCLNLTFSQNSSSYIALFYFQSQEKWEASGSLITSGNIQGIIYRNKQKQTQLRIFNVVIEQIQNPSLTYDNIDILSSPPQDYPIYYFNRGFRVVHSIENNKLQICDLYNYKIQME